MRRRSRPLQFTVILQSETDREFQGYYNAFVPALPGCFSYGANKEEAIKNATEAIQLYIEDLVSRGEPIPEEAIEQVKVII